MTLDEYLALSQEEKNALPDDEVDALQDELQRRHLTENLETPRMKWVMSLKVGDKVQDCRYKEVEIAKITDCYIQGILVDRDILTTDGYGCSASPKKHSKFKRQSG